MSDDIISSPHMVTVDTGVIVQKPFGHAAPPQVGPTGGFSVGASHLPDVGPVVNVAIHDGHGETLLMTLGIPAFREMARLCNDASIAIEQGQFDQPEVMQ